MLTLTLILALDTVLFALDTVLFAAVVCVSTMAAPPRGLYSAEDDGDIGADMSACGTFACATHWALARDR